MKKRVVVNDKMQKRYAYYRTEPVGRNFDPDFTPQLTPREMLKIGVFGGKYLNDCQKEFPKSWFSGVKLDDEKHDPKLNYYGVNAGLRWKEWKLRGWLHKDDPRGWFQWYARYYMGRRHEDDARQIKRWRQIKRHAAQVKKNCKKGDKACRPRQRQTLLHWAYDPRKL